MREGRQGEGRGGKVPGKRRREGCEKILHLAQPVDNIIKLTAGV